MIAIDADCATTEEDALNFLEQKHPSYFGGNPISLGRGWWCFEKGQCICNNVPTLLKV